MLVIVTEAIPDRLRGYLSRWLLEVRAGVFLADYSVKVREMLVKTVKENIETGNVVVAWSTNNESGFDFETLGTKQKESLRKSMGSSSFLSCPLVRMKRRSHLQPTMRAL